MEVLFKSVILVIMIMILSSVWQNYSYFVNVSRLMSEINRRLYASSTEKESLTRKDE